MENRTYIRLRAHGDGLRALSEFVSDVDIVQFEITRPDSQGRGEIIVRLRLLTLGGGDRDLVLAICLVIFGVAKDSQGTAEFRDVDLLGVGAGVDENDLFAGGGVRQSCDSL